MSDDFKSLPTLEKVAERVRLIHKAQVELAQAMGLEIAQLQKTLEDSTAITDQVLQEMGLQITFLMQTIRVTKPKHGGIADVNGKVPMEVKTASQIYQETGRAKLLEQIEAVKRAQGIPTAEDAAAATEASGEANPEAGADEAPLITH